METCLAAGRPGGELLCIMSRFSYIYIFIYTAHTLAHTWSHVCLKTYIYKYTAHTLAHTHFLSVFA